MARSATHSHLPAMLNKDCGEMAVGSQENNIICFRLKSSILFKGGVFLISDIR